MPFLKNKIHFFVLANLHQTSVHQLLNTAVCGCCEEDKTTTGLCPLMPAKNLNLGRKRQPRCREMAVSNEGPEYRTNNRPHMVYERRES